jgi:hypothetical protein
MLKGFPWTLSLPDRLAGAALSAVVALAAWNWYLDPTQAGRWAWAMVLLPALWATMAVYRWWALRVRAPRPDDEAVLRYAAATTRFLAGFVAVMALVQAVALGFDVAGSLQVLDDRRLETRVLGLMSGAVFVVLGNGLPKILTPVSLLPDGGAARISRMRRFIGRSWVLVGLAIVAIFALAPIEVAGPARRWLFVAGVASMVGGIVWVNVWPDRRAA